MKRYKNYILIAMLGALLFTTQSCDLDEYNPGGTTADNVFSSETGFDAVLNGVYGYWGGQFYGREDIVLLVNGGSDTWINIANCGYGRQMSKYQEGNSTTGQFLNTWRRLYEIINVCNACLGRIDDLDWSSEETRNSRYGEASFHRAYAYWMLVEMFGNVELRTTETVEPVFEAYRSTYEELYNQMLTDVQSAVDYIPNTTSDVGRLTKKAAYGLKARIALTYASYCDTQAEKDIYYQMAQDAADYVIEHQDELGVSLYDTPAEVFDPANNKTNTEAMLIATHSTVASLNMNSSNPNRLHIYFHAKYSDWVGIEQCYEYGNDRNSYSGAMCMMPTKHLLELYDETIDRRYTDWFRENYYQTATDYVWTETDLNHFQKPTSMVGTSMAYGDLAMCFTKQAYNGTEDNKRALPYAMVDINDTYDPITGAVSTDANFNIHFPTLLKFEDAHLEELGLPTNSQVGSNDVFMMRLPEMYLIAAECEVMKSNGSYDAAADYLNVIRRRAAVSGHESDMEVSGSQLASLSAAAKAGGEATALDFILDERARELCAEFIRWFDLKRTGNLVRYIKDLNYNPDVAPYVNEYCNLRPIPNGFLTTISNPDEFGQNPGWS